MSLKDIDILVVGPQLPVLMEGLEETFNVHKLWLAEDQVTFLKENASGIRGLVTSFAFGADKKLIDALPNLEIIASFGVGTEKIALRTAFKRNIVVTNTPDIHEPVADLAMILLLAVARRVCEADQFVRAGKWAHGSFPLSTHVGSKTCGIVGLGRIGRAVARRAEAFGMKIAYYGPRRKPDVAYAYYENLELLARDSDFLVLCLPGGEETHHTVNAGVLEALGPKGYLINVARGSVVDEGALIKALQSGQLAGAGLDVFEQEPLSASPLTALDNVVLLPHIASATTETRHGMAKVVFENLKAHFQGRPVLTPLQGITGSL